MTRKITWPAAAIKLGLVEKLQLGNLDAERDRGCAPDYVEVMWRMLQQDEADDYVVATGAAHAVRHSLEVAFDDAGLSIDDHVVLDRTLIRPAEVEQLIGDSSKARRILGWKPETTFEQMIKLTVDADNELLKGSGRSRIVAARGSS